MGIDISMKPRRPFLLWLLSCIFFAAGFRYLLQVIQSIRSWNLLISIQFRFGPFYPVFQGALLMAAFLLAGILLLSQKYWSPAYAGAVVLLTAIWFWVDRVLLNLNPLPLNQQLFAIISSVLLLALILGGLWTLRPYMILSTTETREESSDSSSSGETHE
jgi:uncharacterized membrane protein (GlpM family)